MQPLPKTFATRVALIEHVKTLAPWAKGEHSPIQGGRQPAEGTLARIDPIAYAHTRNFGNGHFTRLSPYIHHGILTLNEVRNVALTRCQQPEQITTFIQELTSTGYLHNHTRMYLAAYVVHFRRVKWQAGAEWFLHHLLDGDLASNNLSWQWVASTFSHKPYLFNLENVAKYFGQQVDCSPEQNRPLDASYDVLQARLFTERCGGPA